MAQTVNYADILANVVQAEGLLQPGLQPIKIAAVCDRQTGHFLLIATGWENNQRFDSISEDGGPLRGRHRASAQPARLFRSSIIRTPASACPISAARLDDAPPSPSRAQIINSSRASGP